MNDKAKWKNKLLGVQQLSQMRLKSLESRSGSPHNNGEQWYGMASGLFNCYESAADVRSTIERHVALETKAGLQLLLLPHSLFPCVHGMLRCRSREEERMMYSCLEKGLGPSLLEERLIEHSCSVKNGPRYFLRKVWEARKQPRPVPAECRRRQKYNY